ncbi:Neuropeptide-Like Protein [Caenorhabditis elegans]|nr:Neuropeptide-Like Protein [Caenorhabditis elegans]CAA92130.2 Neuropeptide-Like Protein [Caenorhabditis elegans]|eukprot:NP_001257098.1 Uncharacterized protein CELE_F41E7.7 [Caenorhabditis elegans]
MQVLAALLIALFALIAVASAFRGGHGRPLYVKNAQLIADMSIDTDDIPPNLLMNFKKDTKKNNWRRSISGIVNPTSRFRQSRWTRGGPFVRPVVMGEYLVSHQT